MMPSKSFVVSTGAVCLSIIIAGGLIAGAVLYSSNRSSQETRAAQNQQEQQDQNKEVSFQLSEKDARLGDKDAPVTIVEFSDYGCPFCKRYHSRTFSKLKKQYISKDKVNYVYKHNPMTRLHPQARKQAIFTQCVAQNADDQAFFDLTEQVFANQEAAKNQKKLYELASQVGVEKDTVSSCITNEETDDKISADKDVAQKIGARGTPTFVIGTVQDGEITGKLLVGAQPFSKFESQIKSVLN